MSDTIETAEACAQRLANEYECPVRIVEDYVGRRFALSPVVFRREGVWEGYTVVEIVRPEKKVRGQ